MTKINIITVFVMLLAGSNALAKKTLVYCSEGSPSGFNPQMATDGSTFNNTRGIYNNLIEFKLGTTKLEPALAKSWKISKNGLEYTFVLRKDVKFHTNSFFKPTRNFNSDDVLFSFNRQLVKTHPFHKVGGGNYDYFNSMDMGKIIKEVKKLGPYKIQIILTRAEAPFLANLGMDFAGILSKEYADQLKKKGTPEKIDFEPVGTGPWIFVRYKKDLLVRYNANDQYFRGRPKLDQLVFSITQDPSVRFQKLKAGECHFVTEPAPADLAAMKKDKNIKVVEKAGLNVGYLAMNVKKKPFDNPLVRKAIHHALNREAYINAIYLGNAKIAKNPIPPSMWSYNSKISDYAYNPDEAKKLLRKAGFEKGFETTIWTLPVSRPYNPNGKKMGEMMQADLAKVGIKVKLVTYDWPTYLDKTRKGEHDMAQLGWTGDNGDPDNFLQILLGCAGVQGGSNIARWCYSPFEKLIKSGKMISDEKKRTQFYQKAQKVFKEQAPWVTLAHAVVYRAMVKNLEGYKIDPFGGDYFDRVDLK